MAPSSAKPRARPEGSGRPTARGTITAGHSAPFAALTLLRLNAGTHAAAIASPADGSALSSPTVPAMARSDNIRAPYASRSPLRCETRAARPLSRPRCARLARARTNAVLAHVARAAKFFPVMTIPNFSDVWTRLLRCADRPFITDGGHEFSYQVEGEALRLSHRNALLSHALLAEAWAVMPCAATTLPTECKPKAYVWTLLHDTRIAGIALLPEIPVISPPISLDTGQ